MSDLTPDQIAEYPLSKGVSGYRVKEVDELLDLVADRIEKLQQRLRERETELDAVRAQAAEATATEAMLKRTLVTAQKAAEDTLDSARQQADELLAAARAEATQLRASAEAEADELRDGIMRDAERSREAADAARRDAQLYLTRLRGAAAQFRSRMIEHLDAHRQLLEGLPDLDDLPPAVDTPQSDDAGPDAPQPGGPPSPGLFGVWGRSSGTSGDAPDVTGTDAG